MKTSISIGNDGMRAFRIIKLRAGLLLMTIICCFHFSALKSQTCNQCCLPSFPTITVYQAFQTGHGMGFGVEAGSWKKDAGKFSYFIGTSMVWSQNNNLNSKTAADQYQALLSFYFKGQYKVSNHIYLVAAPGIVNLTYFEFQTGLRYVVPLTSVIGIGVEPAYAFFQKQFVLNANLHFALR
jgi:hypothetical protein